MTKSTIEHMSLIDSIDIENIPTKNLEELLEGINRKIENYQQDRYAILSELARRAEKAEQSQ
jgi:hypothetical protein